MDQAERGREQLGCPSLNPTDFSVRVGYGMIRPVFDIVIRSKRQNVVKSLLESEGPTFDMMIVDV